MSVTSLLKDDATIASRYLADQVTEVERDAFEVRLIEDPVVLRELEATARLKLGMQNLRYARELNDVVANRNRRSAPIASLAAAAIVVIGVLVLWHRIASERPVMVSTATALRDENGQPLLVEARYAVFRQRSDSYDAEIELSPKRGALELRVLPGANLTPPYKVTLKRRGGGISHSVLLAEPAPDRDGFISLFLDPSGLTSGDYELLLAEYGRPRAAERFSIRVSGN